MSQVLSVSGQSTHTQKNKQGLSLFPDKAPNLRPLPTAGVSSCTDHTPPLSCGSFRGGHVVSAQWVAQMVTGESLQVEASARL